MCKAMAELFKPEIDAAFDNGFEAGFRDTIVKLREKFSNEEIAELLKEPLEKVAAV